MGLAKTPKSVNTISNSVFAGGAWNCETILFTFSSLSLGNFHIPHSTLFTFLFFSPSFIPSPSLSRPISFLSLFLLLFLPIHLLVPFLFISFSLFQFLIFLYLPSYINFF